MMQSDNNNNMTGDEVIYKLLRDKFIKVVTQNVRINLENTDINIQGKAIFNTYNCVNNTLPYLMSAKPAIWEKMVLEVWDKMIKLEKSIDNNKIEKGLIKDIKAEFACYRAFVLNKIEIENIRAKYNTQSNIKNVESRPRRNVPVVNYAGMC